MSLYNPEMISIETPPTRDAEAGEQTLLTYNTVTAAWDLVHLDFGDELDAEGFAVGVTHWLDLVALEPDDFQARRELRQSAWEEESAASSR